MRRASIAVLMSLLLAGPAAGQTTARADSAEAAALLDAARAARAELGSSIVAYEATISRRMRARLRLPLKDRMLARVEEAARVRWSRDGETVAYMVAGRQEDPEGVSPSTGFDLDAIFDPAGERVYFGSGLGDLTDEEENFWIAHPLAEGSERDYRYAVGDTLTLRLPGGRVLRSVELRVTPRRESFHYLTASLWVEPTTGALVRAIYRPSRNVDLLRDTVFIDAEDLDDLDRVPGFLKPIEIDFELIAIEYSLWDFEHWLPYRMSVEGYARAGMFRVPLEVETAYTIESVIDEQDAAADSAAAVTPEQVLSAWGADAASEPEELGENDGGAGWLYVPRDTASLMTSDELPAPIGEASPGFAAEEDLAPYIERLRRFEGARSRPPRVALEWGLRGQGLVRYNRVEALSLGLRGLVEGGPGSLSLTTRLGVADLHPNAELAARLPLWRLTLGAAIYHELAAVEGGAPFGFGNSFGALFLGRDDGDYYRTTGVRLDVQPPETSRPWLRASLWAERQDAVERETDFSLPHLFSGDDFRPNVAANDADLLGATLVAAPWWGISAERLQAGLELFAQPVTGDYRFARARLTGRLVLPFGERTSIAAEAAAGTSWGELPIQYAWFIGGPATLRGYDGATAIGPDMARARLEVARGRGTGALAVFADAGWAGERADFDSDDALLSAGVGVSLLNGLVRLDLAHALREPRGWRLDARFDAPF